MRQVSYLTGVVLLSILFFSCAKDEEPEVVQPSPLPAQYPNFAQLKVGNYWVYERFDIDTLGNVMSRNEFDSCYVETDTVINGFSYLKVVKPKPYLLNELEFSYQRDSLHYIVNSDGKILFSSEDFTSIFESRYLLAGVDDTVCHITRRMTDENLIVHTPARPFLTSTAQVTYVMYPNWSIAGNPRYLNTRYAEDIGIVIETIPFYATNPNYVERRLVRYHLN